MMKKILLAAVAVITLSGVMSVTGCTTAPPATAQIASVSPDKMQPIYLNVAKVEMSDIYKSPMQSPNVEHLFTTMPAAAVQDLVSQKLLAQGDQNILRVIVEDASVVKEDLPVSKDFWGTFKIEPSERYRGQISLRFEMVREQAPDLVIGHATVIAKRTKTVLENASPTDRDRAFVELTEEMMNDVYDGFNTVVKNTFGVRQ